jgi:hypothetical protein
MVDWGGIETTTTTNSDCGNDSLVSLIAAMERNPDYAPSGMTAFRTPEKNSHAPIDDNFRDSRTICFEEMG